MSRFTTRVELYGTPSAEVYEKLHLAMERKGFSRKINPNGLKWFWLPNAEYSKEGSETAKQVLDSANVAATSVWKEFGILVTQTEVGRESYNLKEVK